MMNFLHNFTPSPILLQIGPLTVYWYGLFIVSGILAGTVVAVKLAKRIGLAKEAVIDLVFWLVLWGTVGARLYHVLIELEYYLSIPTDIIKVWQGGLAIHGALIAGIIVLWNFAKKHSLSFWQLGAMLVPGVALGQAIGRWGNYFNQELYGRPSNLPWSIPIDLAKRSPEYFNYSHFHPTFLYESLGNLAIFVILYLLVIKSAVGEKKFPEGFDQRIVLIYFALYSLLRFTTEFIRTDQTAIVLGLRLPQLLSAIVFLACTGFLSAKRKGIKMPPATVEKN